MRQGSRVKRNAISVTFISTCLNCSQNSRIANSGRRGVGAVVSVVERVVTATPSLELEQYGRSRRADGPTWNAAGSGNTSPLQKLNDSSKQPARMVDTCTEMPPSFCCAIGMAYECPNW